MGKYPSPPALRSPLSPRRGQGFFLAHPRAGILPSPVELVTFLVTGKGDGWGEEAEDRERR